MAFQIFLRAKCLSEGKFRLLKTKLLSCRGKSSRDSTKPQRPKQRSATKQDCALDSSEAVAAPAKSLVDSSPQSSLDSVLLWKKKEENSVALPSKCVIAVACNPKQPHDPRMDLFDGKHAIENHTGKSAEVKNQASPFMDTTNLDNAIRRCNKEITELLHRGKGKQLLDTALYSQLQEQSLLPFLHDYLPELLNHPTSWTISHRQESKGIWTMYISTSNTPSQEQAEISHWLDKVLPSEIREKVTIHFSQGSVVPCLSEVAELVLSMPSNTTGNFAYNTDFHNDYTTGDSVGEPGRFAGTLGPAVVCGGQMYYVCSNHLFGNEAGPVFHPAPAENQPHEQILIGKIGKRPEKALEWCHHSPSFSLGKAIPGFSSVLDYRLVKALSETPQSPLRMRNTASEEADAPCSHISSYARIVPLSIVQTSGRTSGGIRDGIISDLRGTVSYKGKIAREWELGSLTTVVPQIGTAGDSGGAVTTKDKYGRNVLCGHIWGSGPHNVAYVTDIVCLMNAIKEELNSAEQPSLIACDCDTGSISRRCRLYLSSLRQRIRSKLNESSTLNCCPLPTNVTLDRHLPQEIDSRGVNTLEPVASSCRARSISGFSTASQVSTVSSTSTTQVQEYNTQNTSARLSEANISISPPTEETFPEVLRAKLEHFKAQPAYTNTVREVGNEQTRFLSE